MDSTLPQYKARSNSRDVIYKSLSMESIRLRPGLDRLESNQL